MTRTVLLALALVALAAEAHAQIVGGRECGVQEGKALWAQRVLAVTERDNCRISCGGGNTDCHQQCLEEYDRKMKEYYVKMNDLNAACRIASEGGSSAGPGDQFNSNAGAPSAGASGQPSPEPVVLPPPSNLDPSKGPLQAGLEQSPPSTEPPLPQRPTPPPFKPLVKPVLPPHSSPPPGQPEQPKPDPQPAPSAGTNPPPLKEGGVQEFSGRKDGVLDFPGEGGRVNIHIANSHQNGEEVKGDVIPPGYFTYARGNVRRNYYGDGRDAYQVTQLKDKKGNVWSAAALNKRWPSVNLVVPIYPGN